MVIAEGILLVVGAYLSVGVVFGAVFAWRFVDRLDPVARRAGCGFRLLILPGAAALWPLLLRRTLSARRGEGAR